MIVKHVSIPLDDDNFLRRQCPLCLREFKIYVEDNELNDLVENSVEDFKLEDGKPDKVGEEEEEKKEEELVTCPYCGQEAPKKEWWTEEQLAYLNIFIENIVSELLNENFIKPLKHTFNNYKKGPISIKFTGKEIEQKTPWISPETNDMKIFDLPCCNKKIKIDEDWNKDIFCYYCSFPHERK